METGNAWTFVESVLTSNVLQAMKVHTDQCEAAILAEDANKMVKNTSAIARLTNRVLQLTKQEADNSGKVLPRQVCYCLLRSISISQPFPRVSDPDPDPDPDPQDPHVFALPGSGSGSA